MRASLLRPFYLGLFFLLGPLLGGLVAPAVAQSATASFVKSDATTQGTWKGVYGADGYSISQDTSPNNPHLPAYAAVSLTGSSNYVWAASTSDTRALVKAAVGSTDRLAACWYSPSGVGGSFDVDVNLTDGQAHRVSLYCLDEGSTGRGETVTVEDAATLAVLDTQTLTSFSGGTYLTWSVKGHVKLHIASTTAGNAVLSALFFDPAAGVRIDAGSSTPYTDGQGNTWAADNAFTGGTTTTTTTTITGTSDPALYQKQRAGSSFSYALSVPNGKYILGLSFAETSSSVTGAGQRVFNVSANGAALVTGLDIYAAAGGANKALTKSFLVNVTNGQLALVLTGTTGQAAVAAISVLSPTPAPDIPPPGWAEDMLPADDASDADGMGPAAASSVNLASGVEENSPGPDLWAYNPVGPGASYERRYRSARAQKGYASPGLSLGWTDGYDLSVAPTGGGYTLTYDNGGQDQWTGTTGSLGTRPGTPYLVSASGTTLTMTFKDRSKYVFEQVTAAGGNYPANTYLLAGVTNLVGHGITLNRDTAANGYRLLTITNDASPVKTLLTFAYLSGKLSTVTDAYGRQITYGFTGVLLGSVSQIVPAGTSSPPARWQYGYSSVLGVSLLSTVLSPDPSHPGSMASAVTTYDPATGAVSKHQDASLRVHSYGYSGSQTTVQVNNAGGSLAESWTQKQAVGAGLNADAGGIDAAGKASSISYVGTPSPYQPNAATNRNGQTTQVTYNDAYGNVLTTTSPRGFLTTFGYGNPGDFALNQVTSVTQSYPNTGPPPYAKQPTNFTYYGLTDGVLNGLLKTVTSPLPDTTTANPGTAPATTYSYDSLGNVTQTTGPNANGLMTATCNYTSDGGVSQAESLGEPLLVTVTGPDANGNPTTTVTHARYDARGNRIAAIDALGNEADYYNLADQIQAVVSPSTVGNLSQRAFIYTTYQYPGGPEAGTQVFAEGAVTSFPTPGAIFPAPAASAFRQVSDVYDLDGELLQVTGNTHPVVYAYDGCGRVSGVTYFQDPNNPMVGRTTTYSYDAVGNLAAVLYPDASGLTLDQTHYTYDPDGNVATETSGVGVTKTYARLDPESLLTGLSYTYPAGYSGTQIGYVTFGYDGWGRRLTMSDDTGTKAYTYDDLDELLSIAINFGSNSYINQPGPQFQQIVYYHNPDGSRQYMRLPKTIYETDQAYQYDGLGRLSATYMPYASGAPTYGSRYTYLPNGWLTQMQATITFDAKAIGAPYLQVDRIYNPRGFLTELTNSLVTHTGALTPLSSYSGMTYDTDGNRLSETAAQPARGLAPLLSRTVTYRYDLLDELTSEVSTPAPGADASASYTRTWLYDLAGNPTTNRSGGASFNADNQDTSLAYTGTGDPFSLPVFDTTEAATFDPEDRLTQTGTTPDFYARYDGDGLRAWSSPASAPSGASYSLYDGDRAIAEMDSSGSEVAYTMTGATGVEMRAYSPDSIPSSQVTVYTYDPQGSLSQPVTLNLNVMPAVSQVRSSCLFDGFGAGHTFTADSADGLDPVGFGGQYGYYWDFSGLYLLTHRYYDAGAGRFVSRDPIGYGGGMNLYGFAGNNPVNRMDPEGTDDIPTNSMNYIGNMFNNLTPHDWIHTIVHNDVTRALKIGVEIYGSILGPEEFGIGEAAGVAGTAITKLNCFVAGTPVQMADGSVKPIERVQAADWVLSRDATTGVTEARQVTAAYHSQAAQVLTLALADQQTGQVVQSITCTPGHPLYVSGQGFVFAGQLAIGNAIVTRAGPALLVKSIVWCHNADGTPRGGDVYNFTVEGDHTYFVGTAGGGAWVHNNSYPAFFEMQLNVADWGTTGAIHFRRANEALLAAFDRSSILRRRLASQVGRTEQEVREAIRTAGGDSPVVIGGHRIGFTWHHALASQAGGRSGVMQLVGFAHHRFRPTSALYHPGGRGGFAEWAAPLGATR